METLLKVGFGKADVTPKGSVPLDGYGNAANRFSKVQRDPLQATCIAFCDPDGNKALLFTVDCLQTYSQFADPVREQLSQEFNIPIENINVSGTHSHSAPAMLEECPEIVEYRKLYHEGLVEAGRKAMADLAPAITFVGTTQTERMNFNRHNKMGDGSFAGDNFGRWGSGFVRHASVNDPWLQVVRYARIGAKDIILVNFQAHPCSTGGMNNTVCSSDVIGELRTYLQMKTGARVAYFQGAAGNHNWRSHEPSEVRTQDTVEYAKLLGDYALRALQRTQQIPGTEVKAVHRDVEVAFDHSDDHLVETVKPIWDRWLEKFDRDASNKEARELGLNSIYSILYLLDRANRGDKDTVPLHALKVGGVGFACAPYEMFGATGMHIKELSPFPITFIVTHCNDCKGYLATEFAFTHGCYEVDGRRYPKGTAELFGENFLEMLENIK